MVVKVSFYRFFWYIRSWHSLGRQVSHFHEGPLTFEQWIEAEHDEIDVERPKVPAWPEDVRLGATEKLLCSSVVLSRQEAAAIDDSMPRMTPNCPPAASCLELNPMVRAIYDGAND